MRDVEAEVQKYAPYDDVFPAHDGNAHFRVGFRRGVAYADESLPTAGEIAQAIHSVTCGGNDCDLDYGYTDAEAADKVLDLIKGKEVA